MTKKITSIFTLILVLLSFLSCKEDVNLIGDFKETAVVYGILDQSESAHMIKITRAFIGPGNALDIAKIPDSSYFSSVDATITEFLGTTKTGNSWKLNDTTINTKSQNGIFYAPTEKMYFFNAALNNDATYKLEIILFKGTSKEFTVTGETKLVNGITSAQSQAGSTLDFFTNEGALSSTTLRVSNTGNSSVINASLQINISEYTGNTITNNVEYLWNTGEAETATNSTYSSSILGKTFYEIIRDNVSKNSNITKRKLDSLTIVLTGGSEEFNNYINANKPSGALTQSKPNYTNLKVTEGNNVIGLFSSKETVKIVKKFYIPLQNPSCLSAKGREFLCIGNITGDLLFKSSHGADASKSYYTP